MPVIRVPVEIIKGGQVAGANIFHFATGALSLADAAAGAKAALTALYTPIRGFYTSDSTIRIGSSVVTVDQSPNQQVISTPIELTGQGGTTANPANSAAIITWRTAAIGRSFRGRTYLGPFTNGVTDGNGTELSSGIQDGIIAAVEDFTDAIDAASPLELVVWSPTRNAGTVVTQGVVRKYLASQRGRL